MDYISIVLLLSVQFPFPVESNACPPASCLVVPISVSTHEIHRGTDIASHIVSHDAPDLHQATGILPPLEDPFSVQDILEK